MTILSPWKGWALLALLPLAAESANKSLQAIRVSTPISMDGHLDEAVWGQAPAATGFTMLGPLFGKRASLATEVKVLYDDHYIYIGARMKHPKGQAQVVRRLHRRDQDSNSDWFTVYLDTLHDHRTAWAFSVNAAGVQRDAIYTGDSNSGDSSWDGVWESAASSDPDGWTAELKIPLSQLRLRAGTGPQVWGINFNRSDQGPYRENSYWEVPPRGVNAFVSRFPELTGIEGLQPEPRREWIPFLTLQRKLETTQLYDDRGWKLRGGLDAHLSLSSYAQLDLTARPDFAQVEVDQSVLNLSTYETFFQEKRPFFLEGMEIFQVAGPSLFYSRRIGKAVDSPTLTTGETLLELPSTADIAGAAKYTAKLASGLSIGVLAAGVEATHLRVQSATGAVDDREVSPYASYGVLRVQQTLDQRGSYVGGFGSILREAGDNGREATVAAVDSVYKSLDRSRIIEGTFAFSEAGIKGLETSGSRTRLRFNQQWASGWALELQHINATHDYDPNDVGALNRADEQRVYAAVTRQWDLSWGMLRNWSWGMDFTGARDQAGHCFQNTYSTWARTDFTTFYSLWGNGGISLPTEDDRELRTFSDPVKKYLQTPRVPWGGIGMDTPGNRSWYGRFTLDVGSYAAGPTTNYEFYQSIKPTSDLEFQVDSSFSRSNGEQHYLETQGSTPVVGLRRMSQLNQTFRAAYALNPRFTVQAFTQVLVANYTYRDLQSYLNDHALTPGANPTTLAFSDRLWNLNLILRWEFLPGSAAYFVYTHGVSTDAVINDRASIRPRYDLPMLRHLPSDDVLQMKVSWLIR